MTEHRPPYNIAGGPGDTPPRHIIDLAWDVARDRQRALNRAAGEEDQVFGELAVPPRVDAAIYQWIRKSDDALDVVHHRLGLLAQAKRVASEAVGAGWQFRSVDDFETTIGTVWVVQFRWVAMPPHRVEMLKTLVVTEDFDGCMVVSHASLSSM